MKGSVPRPVWPAPVAKTTTQPTPNKNRRSTATDFEPPIDRSNQITLAVLEEFSAAKTRGYDPYNASAAAHRPSDIWQRKRKRD